MYEKWNWDECRCERKNYCSEGCPAGQALHPGYTCKCMDFLDEAIPTQYLKEETDSGCGEDHYYNEDADYCVAYNWCPKWNDCTPGLKWNQDACDCVPSSDPVVVTPPEPIITEEIEEIEEDIMTDPNFIEVVEECGDAYRWDEGLGYCVEIDGKKPQCSVGKEWSDIEHECIWKADGCSRVNCRDKNKKSRWYNGACRCFTDKSWCRL